MGQRLIHEYETGDYDFYAENIVGISEVMSTLGFVAADSLPLDDLFAVVSIFRKDHVRGPSVTVQFVDQIDKKHTAWRLRAKLDEFLMTDSGEKKLMAMIYQGLQ